MDFKCNAMQTNKKKTAIKKEKKIEEGEKDSFASIHN